MSGVKRAARVLEIVAVLALVLLLAAVFMPNIDRIPDGKRLAETKQNLHAIQLAVEKFAVDHGGAYPAYLVGGEARWSATVNPRSAMPAFTRQVDCPDVQQLADPLLRGGYLSEYPRNPFSRDGRGVHKQQLTLPLNAPGGDPLRNGVETGRLYGTRFGAYCTSMGQVLGAKYYCPVFNVQPHAQPGAGGQQTLNLAGVNALPIPGLPPGADATYPCWDTWQGQHPANPLPGQFIYAGSGPVVSLGSTSANGQLTGLPHEIDNYILAAFGGPKVRGQDILDKVGCPLRLTAIGDGDTEFYEIVFGDPDGIGDGILFQLKSSGCADYPEPMN